MDLLRRAARLISGRDHARLPTRDGHEKQRYPPPLPRHGAGAVARRLAALLAARLDFLRRPLRLRGSSVVSVPLGVVVLFPCIVIILIVTLFVAHPSPPSTLLLPAGSPPAMRPISGQYDRVFVNGCLDPAVEAARTGRAKAAIVVLARNKELDGVVQSMRSLERHFNRWFHYPYVFLNDGEFNQTFRDTVTRHASAPVEFGRVGPDMWDFPSWIDRDVAREGIARQGDDAVMYGGLESYHKMCRFYSGFFYKHPLLQKYEWYWRLEPDIKYFCDITYDPFVEMIRAKKTYGFTIAVKELRETVPNLFRYASAYKRVNNITSRGLWEMFVEPRPDDEAEKKEDDSIDPDAMEGETYNMCHFWSNFEIARLDWFRSKEYNDFFDMMDRSGGFWIERWGDAPIHSLAAGALLSPSDIHYFRDIGYRHTTIQHCPANAPSKQLPRPSFLDPTIKNERDRRDDDDYWERWDRTKKNGVGCRCRCDTDVVEVEGKDGSCMAEWVDVAGGWSGQ